MTRLRVWWQWVVVVASVVVAAAAWVFDSVPLALVGAALIGVTGGLVSAALIRRGAS